VTNATGGFDPYPSVLANLARIRQGSRKSMCVVGTAGGNDAFSDAGIGRPNLPLALPERASVPHHFQ